MPILHFYGVPPEMNINLKKLKEDVRTQISQITELKSVPEKVTIFFPTDLCSDEGKIIVFVTLFEEEDRTKEVLKRMSSSLKRFLKKKYFPKMKVGVDPILTDGEICSPSTDD